MRINKDYRITYTNNKEMGSASIVVEGIGNYGGKKTFTFDILSNNVSNCSFQGLSNRIYTGQQIRPSITVKNADISLVKDVNYTITYGVNRAIGKGSITIDGKGNYVGSKTLTFMILPKKLAKAKLSRSGKKLKVSYKKVAGNASGYQIAYRKKGSSKWNYKKTKKTSITIKLSSKSRQQVRVRPYVIVNQKYYYGSYNGVVTSK